MPDSLRRRKQRTRTRRSQPASAPRHPPQVFSLPPAQPVCHEQGRQSCSDCMRCRAVMDIVLAGLRIQPPATLSARLHCPHCLHGMTSVIMSADVNTLTDRDFSVIGMPPVVQLSSRRPNRRQRRGSPPATLSGRRPRRGARRRSPPSRTRRPGSTLTGRAARRQRERLGSLTWTKATPRMWTKTLLREPECAAVPVTLA